MNDPRREILDQVAAGKITAEEGAARLATLESEPAPAPPPPAPAAASPQTSIREVRVFSRFGDAEVVGDPTVASAVAEGPHRARQEGDVMVIEHSLLHDGGTFEFLRAGGRSVLGLDSGDKLTVRMNPSLALTAKVQAGNLRIGGVLGPVAGEVQAGSCDLTGFRGPLKLNVSAGSLAARGRLDGGESSIHCNMGEVSLTLDKTSSVRIRARSTLGDVVIDAPEAPAGNELVVGSGAGTLECACTMGSVRIAVE